MIFLDSSALLKRYLDEPWSAFVASLMDEDQQWVASMLARTETTVAICRNWPVAGGLDAELRHLDQDWARFVTVPVDAECLAQAQTIGCDQGLRTLDAIHLAAVARVPGDVRFLSFDQRQRDAAVGLGLPVIVPSGDPD